MGVRVIGARRPFIGVQGFIGAHVFGVHPFIGDRGLIGVRVFGVRERIGVHALEAGVFGVRAFTTATIGVPVLRVRTPIGEAPILEARVFGVRVVGGKLACYVNRWAGGFEYV
jgi:hypothetical protein